MGAKNSVVKRQVHPQRVFSNKTIAVIKITAACILFFTCCLFFFQSIDMFWNDIKKFSPFPVIFFAGVIFICIYIGNLVGHIESKELHKADRFDLLYRIIFTITLLSMVIRSFFAKPYLNVPTLIVCLAVTIGILTWLAPKIIDNDNTEF